ncbi:ABC transporter permease [Proteiniclasticum ruminis]|uniref:ABC transporter permease n=1 Tax=Proteiniclasticum ruminis TaxID=398199 RepID=UPI0028AEBC31|nr:ABC transporter permease [Proteiniclasticum ruminis]
MRKVSFPYVLWMLIFILVPLFLVVYFAFTTGNSNDYKTFTLSLENFRRFLDPIYLGVLRRSLTLSVVSTFICFLLGYPIAYIIATQKKAKTRNNMILLFVIPMWMNFLLRTYAWLTILGKNGIINTFLNFLGFQSLELLYNDGAVILGMVYNFLPFMVLPIYSVLVKMDKKLIEAAEDLGANKRTIFKRVIFPLSVPGVMTGFTMVFTPAVSTFIISNLLGGNKTTLIGNVIEQQFIYTGDWHFGSAMSIILMIIILIVMAISNKSGGDLEGGRGALW